MKTILVTGATGFIASSFRHEFGQKYNFINVSHEKVDNHITLAELEMQPELLKDVDYIINLAGANIAQQRWSNSRKNLLIHSRIDTTRRLISLLNQYNIHAYLISASAIGIYSPNVESDELITINYQDYMNFSQELTKKWELEVQNYRGKYAIARFGVVLSAQGGAFPQMLSPFTKFVGGRIGTGMQSFSWVALPDLLSALDYMLSQQCCGVYNLVAPNVVTNQQLSTHISQIWNRPSWLNLPAWLVKLIFGQLGEELFLNSINVRPTKLLDSSFIFLYPTIDSCLHAIRRNLI